MLAKAVLVATGSDYKKVGVPGEQEYYAGRPLLRYL